MMNSPSGDDEDKEYQLEDGNELVVADNDLHIPDEGMEGTIVDEEEILKTLDPIEKITIRALRMCHLTYERAFAIDQYNLGKKLGEYTMARLMEIFFDRIYKDQTEWFISLFARVTQEDMTQYLADYLLQRLGGDPYYSANKGIPALILTHMSVELSHRVAERWLDHFEDALDDLYEDITSEEKDIVRDHMRYTAYFLVAAQLQQKEDMEVGVQFLD